MSLRSLWMSILILSLHGGVGSGEEVSGAEGGTVTLPCTYAAKHRRTDMCWGRGKCPYSQCNNEIIRTEPDGRRVTWRRSKRYQLLGDIAGRDVSLTIRNITKEDEGKYCCRVEIHGPFNDLIHYINLKVREGGAGSGEEVSGAEGGTVTLPCTYDATYRRTSMCWGRGECPNSGCKNRIIRTDGSSVTRSTSNRYRLLGDIAGGDVSLTISQLTKEDGGKYCCRVQIHGAFNDQKNNIVLKVLEAKTSNPRTASSVRDDTYESGNNEFGENDHKSTDETPNARTTSSAQDYSSKSGNNELDNNVSTEGSGDHSSPTSVTPVKKTPSARSAPASSPAVYIIPIMALIVIFITGMAYRYMKTNKGSASAWPVVGLKAADSTNRTEDNVYIIQ